MYIQGVLNHSYGLFKKKKENGFYQKYFLEIKKKKIGTKISYFSPRNPNVIKSVMLHFQISAGHGN